MNTRQPFQPSLPLSRPAASRWVERVSGVWRDVLRMPIDAWRGWRVRRAHEHQYDAMLNLGAGTLRDIGAPDWVVSHAESRREVEAHRVDEFHLGVRELPSRW